MHEPVDVTGFVEDWKHIGSPDVYDFKADKLSFQVISFPLNQFVEQQHLGSRENISCPFVSVSPPLLAGRRGGAFVTGEPLIKFPLHPWPAARARRDCGGGGAGDGGGLSDSWHSAGLLLNDWSPFDIFEILACEPRSLAWCQFPLWQEMEVKLPKPVTSQHFKSPMYAV